MNRNDLDRCFIIAEAGVNHNGSFENAQALVEAAARSGADAIKFQSFTADALVCTQAVKADYQKQRTDPSESQHAMLRRLELSWEHQALLKKEAEDKGLVFLSTPFDRDSLDFLCDRLGLRTIKIGSGDITDGPLLLRAGRKADHIVLSTGMSSLSDIEQALSVLAFAMTQSSKEPSSLEDCLRSWSSEEGQRCVAERVTLLHCTSEYPAPYEEVHLRVLDTLAQAFGLPVGYSDHTLGVHIAIAAVARGACVLEKHITLDHAMEGPDHRASLEPQEFALMVRMIRETERALGRGVKVSQPHEWSNRSVARKSIWASRAIVRGTTIEEQDLMCKRPGTHRSPMEYWEMIGREAALDYGLEEPV